MSCRIKFLQGRRTLQIKVNQMQCGRLSQVLGISIVMLCLIYENTVGLYLRDQWRLGARYGRGANGKQADESFGEPALFHSLIRQL